MTKQAIGLVFLLGILVAASGCNVMHAVFCDPFGTWTPRDGRFCGTCGCDEACGPICEEPCGPGPFRGGYGVRSAIAGPWVEGCCEECGEVPCGRRCGIIRGPLSLVFSVLGAGDYRDCGFGEPCSGCGERYWGDWYSDPPDWIDPCDCRGNFTGGCSSRGGYRGEVAAGMAGPYEGAVASPQAGGCRSCGQGGVSSQSYGSPRTASQYASRTPRYPYPSQHASVAQGHPTPNPARNQGYSSQYSARTQRYPSRTSSPPHSSGSYSQRLISTTDRVVKPATTEQIPHLAQPLQSGMRLE